MTPEASPNTNPMRLPWVRVLMRYVPDRRVRTLRAMMGWQGPRWQVVRDTPRPWEDPEILAGMSSALGWNASALIPDFYREAELMQQDRRRHFAELDDHIARRSPDWQESVARLRADAHARPRRWR